MKKIIENIPLFSACLIFVGFLNYEFFYRHFNIKIASYLTSTELIFSFLPLTLPFIIVFIWLVVFVSVDFAAPRKRKPNASKVKPPFYFLASVKSVWRTFQYSKSRKHKSKWDKAGQVVPLFLFLVFSIGTFIFRILFIGYVLFSLSDSGVHFLKFSYLVGFSVFWILLLYASLDRRQREDGTTNYTALANLIVVVILVVLLKYKNREDAENILSGNPKFSSCILVNDQLIETDSTLVYVGQTAEYIFIYDRVQRQNNVIKMSDVKDLKIKSLGNEDD